MAEETNDKRLIDALHLALQEFDGVKVDNIVQQGLQISHLFVDRHKHYTALHELVLNYIMIHPQQRPSKLHMKFIDTLSVLIQNKVDVNEGDKRGQTALHLAVSSPGNPEIVRALLSSGARVNQPDNGQQTALHKAVLNGTPDEVVLLLEYGADPNIMDNMGQSPIHAAVKRRNSVNILKELIKCGGKVNLNHPEWNRKVTGATPLHCAARIGRTENAIFLLSQSANPNIVDAAGQTPLHVAATHEISGKLCEALLRSHAKVDIPDNIYGDTALDRAVRNNMVDNVRVLLKYNADPNTKDDFENTCLHKAAANCTDFTIWQLLVKKGGNMEATNSDKQTPLTIAHETKNYTALSFRRTTQIEI